MWTLFCTGFLVDKFGKYKPVVAMSLLLNAIFHHSLMLIPQREIPGTVPRAYVMRHPESGIVEVKPTYIFNYEYHSNVMTFDAFHVGVVVPMSEP